MCTHNTVSATFLTPETCTNVTKGMGRRDVVENFHMQSSAFREAALAKLLLWIDGPQFFRLPAPYPSFATPFVFFYPTWVRVEEMPSRRDGQVEGDQAWAWPTAEGWDPNFTTMSLLCHLRTVFADLQNIADVQRLQIS
jgi:hypothetical protein